MHALVSSNPLILVGLYLPPPADVSVLEVIMQKVITYGVDDVLIIRDFNLTPSPDLDRHPSTSQWALGLAQWMGAFDLMDVWRYYHPQDKGFSCHSASFRAFSRIDLALASRSMMRQITETSMFPRGVSDHAPLQIGLAAGALGVRMWRLSRF